MIAKQPKTVSVLEKFYNHSTMRIIILLFFSTFTLALHANANHHVTLNVKNTPLVDVFAAITTQTDLRFSYPADLININKRISINVNRISVEEVLPLILPGGVDYRLRKTHIILHASATVNRPTEQAPETKKATRQKEENQFIALRDTFFLEKIQVVNSGIPIDDCHNDIIKKSEEKMKRQLTSIFIATAIASVNVTATEPNIVAASAEIEIHNAGFTSEIKERPLQLSFVYPLGTDGLNSSKNAYNLSVNCLFGYTGQVNGIEIGGIVNMNRYGVNGTQIAGISNLSGPDSRYSEDWSGIQIAGISNNAQGSINMQFAGIVNSSKQKTNVQASGIANYSNHSNLQVGGVVNVTKKGGLQVGLVNVRDTADGVSIGLVNIVKRGGLMEVEVATGELLQTAVSFRSGTNTFYAMLSVGANYTDSFWGAGAGFGTNIRFSERFGLNLEVLEYTFYDKKFFNAYSGNEQLVQLRPAFNYRLSNHFKLFVGPTANLLFKYNTGYNSITTAPYSIYSYERGKLRVDSWVGFAAGVRF